MSVTVMDEDTRASALKKLKAAAVLQFTLFGVPCIYYGDEVGMEGYADPFCRMPFPWDDIDEDLLFHYKRLAKIRSKMSVFREGGIGSFMPIHNVLSMNGAAKRKSRSYV